LFCELDVFDVYAREISQTRFDAPADSLQKAESCIFPMNVCVPTRDRNFRCGRLRRDSERLDMMFKQKAPYARF